MTNGDLERHWSQVGREIRDRGEENLLAGDDTPYYRYKAELFLATFLPQVPVEGRTVLDVGCGAGRTLKAIASRQPARLAGCDQAGEMVALAKQTLGGAAEIAQIDGEHLPFSDKEFDLITTVTVLQHNGDRQCSQLIGEICRVAGHHVFLFEDTRVRPSRRGSGGEGAYRNFYPRTVQWYADTCGKHGFDLVDTQYLKTFVSHLTLVVLSRLFDRRKRTEGSTSSKLHLALEARTMPITSRLDRVVRYRGGELTMMHLSRRN